MTVQTLSGTDGKVSSAAVTTPPPGSPSSAQKDAHHITPEWELLGEHMDGVHVREVKHIVTRNGLSTEIFRKDWGITPEVLHAIHVMLRPGTISAWHRHAQKTDHLFLVGGMLRIVLYDDRDGSPTRGKLEVLNLSDARPSLVVIPPLVWHGIHNVWHEPSCFVNYFDREYDYEDPDEWRLPADTDEIPYRFG
jgi:dTDP-4-dehydrorhamnose 3,5-epimerase